MSIDFTDDGSIVDEDTIFKRIRDEASNFVWSEDQKKLVLLQPKEFFSASMTANSNGISAHLESILIKNSVLPSHLVEPPFSSLTTSQEGEFAICILQVAPLRSLGINFKTDPDKLDPNTSRGDAHCLFASNPFPLPKLERAQSISNWSTEVKIVFPRDLGNFFKKI